MKRPYLADDCERDAAKEPFSCALCGIHRPKDEMYRVEIDEPGAFEWVCEDCYERGQP